MRRVLASALTLMLLGVGACADHHPLRLRGEATATGTSGEVRSITLTGHGSHLRVRVVRDPARRVPSVPLGLLSPLPGRVVVVHLAYGPNPHPSSTYWLSALSVRGDEATFDIPVSVLGSLKVPFRFAALGLEGSFPANGP